MKRSSFLFFHYLGEAHQEMQAFTTRKTLQEGLSFLRVLSRRESSARRNASKSAAVLTPGSLGASSGAHESP